MMPMGDNESYRIGAFARAAGVGVETVRFYEREGLLAEPPRRGAVHHRGYRLYGSEDLRRLRFIVRAKELGFTLKEIGALLALRAEGAGACEDVRAEAERHFADVEARLRDLTRIRNALRRLVEECAHSDAACPILDFLDQEK